jgi:hypothetical protein
MKNKKSYNNVTIFLIIILFVSSIIGIVEGHQNLSYHKYGYPVFTIGNEPLIYSYNTSYSLGNTKYERPFYSSSDDNLFLAYSISGKKYLGRQVRLGDSCIPLQFYDVQVNAPYSICVSTEQIAPNGTTLIPEVMVYYSTTIPEIDEYVNNPSFEGEILVHYNITNPKISEVSPIILNLGKLPIRVNDERIEDVLNKPISNDTILIIGSNTSMILNKGNSNLAGISTISGSVNYTGPKQLLSVPRTNPDFSYIFYKNNGDYFVKIQRITQIQEGILSLTFRLIQIDYSIKIVDPIIENTLNFLDIAPERLRFKPNLQINISNNEIHQLNFSFVNDGNPKYRNITLQNGTYIFNEYVDANGNSFLYPFDHYISKITVNPPLLITDRKDIPTQSNSGFNADIEIDYNDITFTLSRSLESIIFFLIGIITVIISFFGLFIKSEKDVRILLLSFVGVLISISSLLTTNGFNHIISLGSILILISIIFPIVIYYKQDVPRKIQPTIDTVKNDKAAKKKRCKPKKR